MVCKPRASRKRNVCEACRGYYGSNVRFGTYFFLQAPPGKTGADILPEEVDQMVLAEDLGFDSVWLTEHHYADYGLSSPPSVLLATLAAKTRRVHLGVGVYVIPFHH